MGIIDPMMVGSAATTGVLEFSIGPILWWMTASVLAMASAALALSGLHLGRIARLKPPKLVHAQLVAVGASRASRRSVTLTLIGFVVAVAMFCHFKKHLAALPPARTRSATSTPSAGCEGADWQRVWTEKWAEKFQHKLEREQRRWERHAKRAERRWGVRVAPPIQAAAAAASAAAASATAATSETKDLYRHRQRAQAGGRLLRPPDELSRRHRASWR